MTYFVVAFMIAFVLLAAHYERQRDDARREANELRRERDWEREWKRRDEERLAFYRDRIGTWSNALDREFEEKREREARERSKATIAALDNALASLGGQP